MIRFEDIQFAIAVVGILLSAATGALALARDFRSFAYRAYALGMAALVVEGVMCLLCMRAVSSEQAAAWARWRFTAAAFIPGSWLLFAFSYARQNYKEFVAEWKWVIAAFFAVPVALVLFFSHGLFVQGRWQSTFQGGWIAPLDWAGYAFFVVFLLACVLIITNLEKTLRTSYGAIRWQIKFSILGIGILFAVRIYTSTQVLLFSMVNTELFKVNNTILVVANVLVILSAIRNRLRNVDLYVSQEFLYSSFTLLLVGLYLLGTGIVAKLAIYLGFSDLLFQNGLLMFVVLLGVSVLLLSEHMRYKVRIFVQRHFRKPSYDYRNVWTRFTQKTASLIDLRQLCAAVTKTISETFSSSAVSIWLIDEDLNQTVLGGSTAVSLSQAGERDMEKEMAFLTEMMRGRQEPVDLTGPEWDSLPESLRGVFQDAKIRYGASLVAGGEFVGMLTINGRTGEPFSVEDFELLKTFADQTAVLIMNQKLFGRFSRAREMQAFQTVSAFFAHDLKNVASTLSMTLKNMAVHYDNPEFRKDALKMISISNEKIQNMCGRLSMLNQKFELEKCECDLNEIVSSTLAGVNLGCNVVSDLHPVPKACMDGEQVRKVILNLVLNASEALNGLGEIRIATGQEKDSLVFSISDTGRGMTREFIGECLFHPFKTTKKTGSGIGLYQCKMIVEAHKGRIEVNSREGAGSTFRVYLPM
ncbi:MAG: XrtA/PEP-CTERM system histidine kinase PrsK [Syntrophobacter sp.]